jgi:hypothetical protein
VILGVVAGDAVVLCELRELGCRPEARSMTRNCVAVIGRAGLLVDGAAVAFPNDLKGSKASLAVASGAFMMSNEPQAVGRRPD